MTDPLDRCGAEFHEAHRPRFKNGKQLAAGEGEPSGHLDKVPPAPPRGHAAKLDKPKRPCSACGLKFQPTQERRLLCYRCWRAAGQGSPMELLY